MLSEGAAAAAGVEGSPESQDRAPMNAPPPVGSPRRRSPSPTGKVDRAQPGTDEGKQPKSEKQATLNGSVFPFNVACLVIWVRPLIRHALRRATFPVGEGFLPAGAFPYLPLGEGGSAEPRRMRGGSLA